MSCSWPLAIAALLHVPARPPLPSGGGRRNRRAARPAAGPRADRRRCAQGRPAGAGVYRRRSSL